MMTYHFMLLHTEVIFYFKNYSSFDSYDIDITEICNIILSEKIQSLLYSFVCLKKKKKWIVDFLFIYKMF